MNSPSIMVTQRASCTAMIGSQNAQLFAVDDCTLRTRPAVATDYRGRNFSQGRRRSVTRVGRRLLRHNIQPPPS